MDELVNGPQFDGSSSNRKLFIHLYIHFTPKLLHHSLKPLRKLNTSKFAFMAAIVLLMSELLKTETSDLLAPAAYYSNPTASINRCFGVDCGVKERKRGVNCKRNSKNKDQEIGESLEDVKIAVHLIWP
jgi:hypothetical protein